MHTIESVKKAMAMAEADESRISSECLEGTLADCQTGPGTRRLLNNLLSAGGGTYLEVGMYYGGSFACALNGNKVNCAYGIDMLNVDYESKMRAKIMDRIWKFHTLSNGRVILHFEDAFKFEVQRIIDPVTVYLYDADHSKEGHRKGITHFWPALADRFVLLIDDWNWQDVRDGTEAGLKEVGASVLHRETFSDMSKYYNGLMCQLVEK